MRRAAEVHRLLGRGSPRVAAGDHGPTIHPEFLTLFFDPMTDLLECGAYQLPKIAVLAVALVMTACGGGGDGGAGNISIAPTASPSSDTSQPSATEQPVQPASHPPTQPVDEEPGTQPPPGEPSTPLPNDSPVNPATVINRKVLGIVISTPTRLNQRSLQEVHDALFSDTPPSVRTFYRIQSGGTLNVTNRELTPPDFPISNGSVIEVRIDAPAGDDCTADSWGNPAKTVATAMGFNPNDYDSTFYITPPTVGCANGVGTTGTPGQLNTRKRVVYFDKLPKTQSLTPLTSHTLIHELGHNIGLSHARTLICTDAAGRRVALSDTCTETTQGDPTDAMGAIGRVIDPGPPGNGSGATDPNAPLLAAPRAYTLGWVTPSEVLTVTTPGYYRLRPLYCSKANGAYRAIRLKATTSGKDYWLETRQPCGGPFDNFRSGSLHRSTPETTVNGLLIRLADTDFLPSRQTWLLDLHPATTNSTSGFVDAALSMGEVFADPLPGGKRFEITQIEGDGTLVIHIW